MRGLVGLHTASSNGDPSCPAWGGRDAGTGVFAVPKLLLLQAGGLQQPWHRAGPAPHLGSPAVIYDSQGPLRQKVYSSRKINSSGKKPQPLEGSHIADGGHREAKSRERYKSLHPSEFSLPDSCASVYRNTGHWRKKIYMQHISAGWSHKQLNVSHRPHPAERKLGLGCRRSADGWPDFQSRNPSKEGFFGSLSLWSSEGQSAHSNYKAHVTRVMF